jgi:hypothetical protein
MASSITSITPIQGGITVFGNKRIVIADIVIGGSSTWSAGGIALTASQFGLQAIDTLIVASSTKAQFRWGSDILQAYISTVAGSAQALATGQNVEETIRVVVIGYGLK